MAKGKPSDKELEEKIKAANKKMRELAKELRDKTGKKEKD